MVWSPVPKSSGLVDAFDADKPAILAQHHVRDSRLITQWTTTGVNAGPYVSDPNAPIERLYDGRLYYPSSPTNEADTVYFINFRFTPVSLDAIFFELINTSNDWDVTFGIDDDPNFGTEQVLFTWNNINSGLNGHHRYCSIDRDTLYTGVEYARLRFERVGAGAGPNVGEVCIGRSLQLSRKFNIPYDDEPIESKAREFEAKNRGITRYVDARGFRDLLAQWTPTGSDNYGLDDVSTIRQIFSHAKHGTEPIVYVENPSSAPDVGLFGFGSLESRLDLQGPYKRNAPWMMQELPPFQARET